MDIDSLIVAAPGLMALGMVLQNQMKTGIFVCCMFVISFRAAVVSDVLAVGVRFA